MNDISEKIYRIRMMDDVGEKNSVIHKINPAIKIIVSLAYIMEVISLKNFKLSICIIILLYTLIVMQAGKVPKAMIFKRIAFVLLIPIGISFTNLLIDPSYNQLILSLILLFKCIFSVMGGLLLIATTGMNNIAVGLRKLKIPKILVLQILMIYRYLALMLEYGESINSAYRLRALNEKGIQLKDFGNIIGQMLLKSFDRAENVYAAMKLRGFEGEYYTNGKMDIKIKDYCYLILWMSLFAVGII